MTAAATLIPELDDIVRHGDPKRRAEAARQISELFLQGAASFRADHVDLFDGVLTDLVPHAELAARADLAERLSLLANAPRGLVGQLAREDEIAIAGPLLRRSPVIDEKALIEIAAPQGPGPSAGDVGAADAVARSHRRHRAPRRPRSGAARRRQCRRGIFADRIFDADQARQP